MLILGSSAMTGVCMMVLSGWVVCGGLYLVVCWVSEVSVESDDGVPVATWRTLVVSSQTQLMGSLQLGVGSMWQVGEHRHDLTHGLRAGPAECVVRFVSYVWPATALCIADQILHLLRASVCVSCALTSTTVSVTSKIRVRGSEALKSLVPLHLHQTLECTGVSLMIAAMSPRSFLHTSVPSNCTQPDWQSSSVWI